LTIQPAYGRFFRKCRNNFIAAKAQGRMTAGEAAKLLSKKFACKITARQIEPLATEFHHAGRFGNDKAKRVFFFSPEELDRITLADIENVIAPVWGWVLGFKAEYGSFGKKYYVPIVGQVDQFSRDKAHRLGKKFHPLSEAEAAEAKSAVGKILPAFCDDWRHAK
jgi:hypothetical protein